MIKDILKHPDPGLYKVSEPVAEGEDVSSLIEDLLDTCELSNGLGLAAPQIGKNVRVLVFKRNDNTMTAVVNPRIVKVSGIKINSTEQCLSVPDKTVVKKRAYSIRIVGSNGVDVELKDRESCVAQHEIEHLDGILII